MNQFCWCLKFRLSAQVDAAIFLSFKKKGARTIPNLSARPNFAREINVQTFFPNRSFHFLENFLSCCRRTESMSVFCRVAKWRRGIFTSESSEKNESQKTAKLFSETNFVGNQRKKRFSTQKFLFSSEVSFKVASPQKNQSLI